MEEKIQMEQFETGELNAEELEDVVGIGEDISATLGNIEHPIAGKKSLYSVLGTALLAGTLAAGTAMHADDAEARGKFELISTPGAAVMAVGGTVHGKKFEIVIGTQANVIVAPQYMPPPPGVVYQAPMGNPYQAQIESGRMMQAPEIQRISPENFSHPQQRQQAIEINQRLENRLIDLQQRLESEKINAQQNYQQRVMSDQWNTQRHQAEYANAITRASMNYQFDLQRVANDYRAELARIGVR